MEKTQPQEMVITTGELAMVVLVVIFIAATLGAMIMHSIRPVSMVAEPVAVPVLVGCHKQINMTDLGI